jgi:hypothetical protein
MMAKLSLSKKDIEVIAARAAKVSDYYEDFQLLAHCKNLKDIDKAKINSLTDMGEGRSESELKDALETYGLKYKFDTVLLILLEYVLFNMVYELTESLENELTDVKLPKTFFADYISRLKNTSTAINKILNDYSNDSAKKLLLKAEGNGAYSSVISAKKDPGALVTHYVNFWMGSSFKYIFNELKTASGIKDRLENCD